MAEPNSAPRVLIFDSGVGGLTIAHEVNALCPGITIDYLSDNVGFPYGNKSSDFIVQRCLDLLSYMQQNCEHGWDLIIIACNTASTLALPSLREAFSIPIIGVVPAIKPAAEQSRSRYIGLLATPATVRRPYTLDLIRDYAGDCTVVSVGSSHLVQLAERKLRGEAVDIEQIKTIVSPFQQASATNPTPDFMDSLVLACTHFPLLKDEIAEAFARPLTLIDSGNAIARRTQHLLGLDGQPAKMTDTATPVVDGLIGQGQGNYWYTSTGGEHVSCPSWPNSHFFAESIPLTR